MAFIRSLDVDYDQAFSCPICSQLSDHELTIIIDAKEMGLNAGLTKPYVSPMVVDPPTVPVAW